MGVLKHTCVMCALVLAACYSWDPNGQPCRQSGTGATVTFECDNGYSCLRKSGVAQTECVRDSSRKRGEECAIDDQEHPDKMCSEGLSCVEGICRLSCGASYFSATDCLADEFCKPYPGESTGFCSPSECLNTSCPTGRICATLKANVGACLIECTPSFNNGQYTDNCGSTNGATYCQAVGSSANRRLVCLDTTKFGQRVGTSCNPIDNPCGADQADASGDHFGLTCVNNTCRELCDPTIPNPQTNTTDCPGSIASGAQYCCSQQGATNGAGQPIQWGICIPSASQCVTDHYPDG